MRPQLFGMRHILVTGGAGFIGSNLISALLKDFKVTAIDNLDDFYSREQKELNLKPLFESGNFIFIEGDLRQTEVLEMVPDIDVIIHLAARAGTRPSINEPMLYHDVNVRGTQILLEFAKNRHIKQFLFASSSSVYGINENVPWTEEERLMPISPYASTKLAGEVLGHVYSELYGIRFLALRFFTVYGPGQRPDLAIHSFFRAMLNDVPISVYGDGSTSRDYTYINDIIKGVIAAIDYDKTGFEIINLGNNKTVTLAELIEAIENTCGKKALIKNLPQQPGDVPKTYANISKAKDLLGYNPSTNLDEGLEKFYTWFKENRAILQ